MATAEQIVGGLTWGELTALLPGSSIDGARNLNGMMRVNAVVKAVLYGPGGEPLLERVFGKRKVTKTPMHKGAKPRLMPEDAADAIARVKGEAVPAHVLALVRAALIPAVGEGI
jgi:hypothetical protein